MSDLSAIVDQLEEDIVFGRLRPRERLVEDDLLATFQTKKHIVRQALVELEQKGLVQRIRNKGALVREYSPEDVRNIFSLRRLLEGEAVREIPLPAPSQLIDALEEVFAEHDRAVRNADLRTAFRSNIVFHRILFEACGNPYLSEAIEQFAFKSHAIRSYSLADPKLLSNARDDHRAIIDAIRAGDREALEATTIRHLRPAEEAYIAAYERTFGIMDRRAG